MKRSDLIKKLKATAKAKGLDLDLVREGGEHTIYAIGTKQVSVPRHREVNEITAQNILKHAEKETP